MQTVLGPTSILSPVVTGSFFAVRKVSRPHPSGVKVTSEWESVFNIRLNLHFVVFEQRDLYFTTYISPGGQRFAGSIDFRHTLKLPLNVTLLEWLNG